MDSRESLSGPTNENFWDWSLGAKFLTHFLRNKKCYSLGVGGAVRNTRSKETLTLGHGKVSPGFRGKGPTLAGPRPRQGVRPGLTAGGHQRRAGGRATMRRRSKLGFTPGRLPTAFTSNSWFILSEKDSPVPPAPSPCPPEGPGVPCTRGSWPSLLLTTCVRRLLTRHRVAQTWSTDSCYFSDLRSTSKGVTYAGCRPAAGVP